MAHLKLTRDPAKKFPALDSPTSYRTATIWFCKYKSLEPLAALVNLEQLQIAGFKGESLDVLAPLEKLRYLRILGLPNVTDLAPLAKLHHLESLVLENGVNDDELVVESFAPLFGLERLRHLSLTGVSARDKSLGRLSKLDDNVPDFEEDGAALPPSSAPAKLISTSKGDPRAKAQKILFSTYWAESRWRQEHTTPPEDLAFAKAHGLMFDPVTMTHDACVDALMTSAKRLDPEKPARAFLNSLSKQHLAWRSAIVAHTLAKTLKRHAFKRTEEQGCSGCKSFTRSNNYVDEDINVLNFERIKWGGVRYGNLLYTWFDLSRLEAEDVPEPSVADIEAFRTLLGIIEASPADADANTLKRLIPESIAAPEQLINALAIIGVLQPHAERPTRDDSPWQLAAWWRGADGYDHNTVKRLFGRWL